MKANEYLLNFTIPKGANALDEPKVYAEYFDNSTSGNMRISNIVFYQPNQVSFENDTERIIFRETGYYEFTISGTLKNNSNNLNSTVILRTTNTSNVTNDLIRIQTNATNQVFYQTKVGRYGTLQRATMIFQKDTNSSAVLENVKLYIKKYPFLIN